MTRRAAADANFPAICSFPVPAGTKNLDVEWQDGSTTSLSAQSTDPRRVLVLGDTGCRVKGHHLQACNDSLAWPFAGLAKAAANLKPDLVIHLGDYVYRESACPVGNQGCAGSPFGDTWTSWNADFFEAAAPLLVAAPWLFVRGNHEDCSRFGVGFLRLLGPEASDSKARCKDHLSPFTVSLGEQLVAVMDTASASDTSIDDASVALYRSDFNELMAMTNSATEHQTWLIGHRPIWAAVSGPLGVPIGGNATMIAAVGDLRAFDSISLMLSGHIHTFEAINYDGKVPPQIVAGHGGDNLDSTPANLRGAIFQGHSGVSVKDGLSVGGFGFLMFSRMAEGDGWLIQLYDAAGVPKGQCTFASRHISCPATQ